MPNNLHIKDMSKTKQKSPSFFGGEYTLRVIGFIADITAIVTVIFAIKVDAIARFLPFMVSPWVLLPIWLISFYTYVCWLHYYWESTKILHGWSNRFSVFFLGEMVLRLKKPVTLLPLLVIIIAGAWIAQTTGIWWYLFVPFALFAFIYFVIIVSDWPGFRHKYLVSSSVADKELVDSRWVELAPIIQTKTNGFNWLTAGHLNDIMVAWEINEPTVLYAFAKFAAERPEQFQYGNIKDKYGNAVAHGALIVLKNFDTARLKFW